MALQHIAAGEVINLNILKAGMVKDTTQALVKTQNLEVIRLVIPKGKQIPEHQVQGQITVQCLHGHIHFHVAGKSKELKSGDWLFLEGSQAHSLEANQDSVILVTILLKPAR